MEKSDETICPNCKKSFVKKHPKQKFCSQNCSRHYPRFTGRKKCKRVCPNCRKEFGTEPKELKKFCSKKCYHQYFKEHNLCKGPRVTVTCLNCGKNFTVLPSIYKREKRKFCSHKCFYEYKKLHPHKLNLDRHEQLILNETKKLEKQGYKCLPFGLRHFPKPDIIALKENKITAVEVDIYTNSKTKYNKHKTYFDKIQIKTFPVLPTPS